MLSVSLFILYLTGKLWSGLTLSSRLYSWVKNSRNINKCQVFQLEPKWPCFQSPLCLISPPGFCFLPWCRQWPGWSQWRTTAPGGWWACRGRHAGKEVRIREIPFQSLIFKKVITFIPTLRRIPFVLFLYWPLCKYLKPLTLRAVVNWASALSMQFTEIQ